MTWRDRLLAFLRVPHEPAAPVGDQSITVFRAAPNFLRYRQVQWALRNLGALVGLLWALSYSGGLLRMVPEFAPFGFVTRHMVVNLWYLIEASAVAGFVAHAVGSFVLLRLDFDQRWYIVSDRSLRIREGIIRLHEKTMTFANVQNVSVRQGPLQRLLGIADVQVRSAGGGDHTPGEATDRDARHVAYFRGVADAEAIRDAIRERLRRHRDAGLGDLDDRDDSPPLLEPARELAREARLLRMAVSAPAK